MPAAAFSTVSLSPPLRDHSTPLALSNQLTLSPYSSSVTPSNSQASRALPAGSSAA